MQQTQRKQAAPLTQQQLERRRALQLHEIHVAAALAERHLGQAVQAGDEVDGVEQHVVGGHKLEELLLGVFGWGWGEGDEGGRAVQVGLWTTSGAACMHAAATAGGCERLLPRRRSNTTPATCAYLGPVGADALQQAALHGQRKPGDAVGLALRLRICGRGGGARRCEEGGPGRKHTQNHDLARGSPLFRRYMKAPRAYRKPNTDSATVCVPRGCI
jgi:hypothetical protein